MCNSPNSVIFPWTHLYHPAYISAPLPLRLQRSSLPLTLTFSPPLAPVPTPLPLAPTCLLRIAYTSLDPCTAMTVPVTLALDLLLLTAPSVFGKRCNVLRAAHGVIKRLGAPNLPNTHYLPRLFMHTQPTLNVLPHHGRHSTLLPHASRLLSPDPALHPRVALPPSPVVSLCPLYPCPCSMPTSSNTILSMILTPYADLDVLNSPPYSDDNQPEPEFSVPESIHSLHLPLLRAPSSLTRPEARLSLNSTFPIAPFHLHTSPSTPSISFPWPPIPCHQHGSHFASEPIPVAHTSATPALSLPLLIVAASPCDIWI
jgi:hypothetical protein